MSRKFSPKMVASCMVLVFCSACGTMNLEALKQADLPNDPYAKRLAEHYLAFSQAEAEKYDWSSSAHFADKGLDVTYGKSVLPEDPSNWVQAGKGLEPLRAAHKQLFTLTQSNYRKTHPEIVADAVFYYDCWIEEANEGWQESDIKTCRDAYKEALRQLEEPKPAEIPQDVSLSTSEVIYFGWNKASITGKAAAIVEKIAKYVTSLSQRYEVVLNGHTDRSGNAEQNLTLSHKRAEMVKQALKKRGVKEDQMSIFAFGESDLKISTKDGAREPANRRVEIFIE